VASELTIKSKQTTKSIQKKNDQFIVAIGASAGGLEAILELFDNLPHDTGLSFVVIQHLSPDYKSLLSELLSKHTQMQVKEVQDGMLLMPNCVYVIPTKVTMSLRQGKLRLLEKKTERVPNTAIDIFFTSLAEEKKDKAIAIILSGTGTDGTCGIEAIKNSGGFVMVQDPLTAKFDGMPNSAILSGCTDVILPPEMMAEELLSISKNLNFSLIKADKMSKTEELLLVEILKVVNHFTHFDFLNYKRPTLARRIAKRMTQLNIASLREYLEEIISSPEEAAKLSKEFLIGVTKFFRDEFAFEILKKKVIPEILSNKKTGESVKVWIVGCSTGEEAYSLAMLFADYIEKHKLLVDLKIFASDIDKSALETAAQGVYPDSISKDISDQRLKKYFFKEKDKYLIKPELRKLVVFAHHDIAKNPPFSKIDLISCRNMLIYMDTHLQKKILSLFHFGLNMGGFLFLGASENIGESKSVFAEINKKWKIYKSVAPVNLSAHDLLQNSTLLKLQTNQIKNKSIPKLNTFNINESFTDLISEEYGFSGVLVDENYELKQAIGDYNKFLQLPSKKLNFNLLKMVPEEVSIPLGSAIRKAIKQKEKIALKNIRIVIGKNQKLINILVKPILDLSDGNAALIVFNETSEIIAKKSTSKVSGFNEINKERLRDIEIELKETKENLQAVVEELETSNEELQSSNEELLSANEELQSTNEELQSLNEELHTVNTEHQLKIKELIELNDDLNNYFRNTEIGQIFLDKNLIIRKFTPSTIHQINVIESDIGRSFTHISNNLNYQGLADDILKTINYGISQEKEVKALSGKYYHMRVVPYLKHDKKTDGAVVTFVDVTYQKEVNNLLQEVLDSSLSGVFFFTSVRNKKGVIIDFEGSLTNDKSQLFLEIVPKEFHGKRIKKDKIKHLQFIKEFTSVVQENFVFTKSYRNKLENKHFTLSAVKVNDGIVVTLNDISENIILTEERDKAFDELLKAKEKLSELNAKLEARVVERSYELEKSEDRFRLLSKATNDAIWDWNLKEKKIWWNDGYYILFGYKAQYTDTGSRPWQDLVHPNDYQKVIDGLDKAIENKSDTWAEKFRFLKADGTYAFVFSRALITYDRSGLPVRLVGSMMDITEIKNMQEELVHSMERVRFVAESMPQKVWTANANGNMEYMNERWLTYTGLGFNELRDWKWQNVIHRDDVFDTTRLWKQSLETGQDFQIEHRILRYDGKYRWHLTRGIACKDGNGKVISWVGTNTDIHDKILAGERKDEFIGVASHELKTPLTSLKAYTQLLEQTISEKNFEDSDLYIKKTNVFIDRLDELISDLLDVSKIQSGQLQYNMSEFNFDDLVKESIDHFRQTNKKHKINYIGNSGVKILGDKARLEQVFSNYLSNAIKYSPKANKIDVEVSNSSSGIQVGIRDYGIGIPQEKIENIFQRFYRVEGMDHRFQGLGLGLFIASQIVQRHGGKCWVESEEDAGSTFWFELPKTCIVN
jgi:two-component system, chemotaxis family, CheB/CheR fusion protein